MHIHIPPHLIHIVPSHETLSDEYRWSFEQLALGNPGWKQIIFSDEEAERYIKDHCHPRYAAALARLDSAYGPARSDLQRYLIMYHMGGVYLDTKSGLSRPLNEILAADDEFIVSQWQNGPGEIHEGFALHPELADVRGGEYQNWVIVSRPGHPFLAAVIDQVVENIAIYSVQRFGTGKHGVLRLTGPIAYTLTIHPLLGCAPYRRVTCVDAGFLYATSGISDRHVLNAKLHYSRLSHPIVLPHENAGWREKLEFRLKRLVLLQISRLKQWNRRRRHARRASSLH